MKNLMMSLSVLGVFGLFSCSSNSHKHESREVRKTAYNDQALLRQYIAQWPVSSRYAAEEMINKYGLPKSISREMLVWEDTGFFKRSIVYREGVTHNFPTPHEDVLQQFVGYKVPAGKLGDLWRFNGSILVDRTRGEISSRCNREEMNYLSLNLADAIIQNRMSFTRARATYDASAKAFMNGNPDIDYMAGLDFSEYLNAGDPDHTIQVHNRAMIQAEEARPEDE